MIRWDPPGDTPWAMTPAPTSSSADRTRTKIVVALTFACTVMSLYDLYLLGAGF